jgi:hypothetical protein
MPRVRFVKCHRANLPADVGTLLGPATPIFHQTDARDFTGSRADVTDIRDRDYSYELKLRRCPLVAHKPTSGFDSGNATQMCSTVAMRRESVSKAGALKGSGGILAVRHSSMSPGSGGHLRHRTQQKDSHMAADLLRSRSEGG